jgi:hypothetical protein
MAVLDAGIVEVFSGPVRIARLEGSEPGQDFGRAIAEAGDVNLDGVPDLAVAAPHGTAPGGPSAGRVTVFAGGSNAPLAESGGDIDGGQFGYALASAPDASAPGGRRLVIGQPSGLVNGLTSPGYVRAWRPGVAGFAWTAAGSSAGDAFGWSVSSGVDLDGDGGFETAAGAPNAHGGRGEVKVLGPAGLVAWSSPGMEDSGQLGFAVSLVPEPPAGGGGRVAGGAPGAAVPHVFPGAPAPATGTGAGLVKLWTGGGASVGEARGIVGGSAMGFALTAAILRSASPAGDPTIVLVVGAPIEAANGIVRLLAVP